MSPRRAGAGAAATLAAAVAVAAFTAPVTRGSVAHEATVPANTPFGRLVEFYAPANSSFGQPDGFGQVSFDPVRLAPGPNGEMWFYDDNNDAVGLVTPGGSMTELPASIPGPPQATGSLSPVSGIAPLEATATSGGCPVARRSL